MEKLDGDCTGLAFSRDGLVLAAVSITGEISLWSLTNSPPTLLNRWEAEARLTCFLELSPDGKNLAIAGLGERVRLWDISEPKTPRELPAFDGTAFPAAISPDGNWLVAAGSGAHVLRRWALSSRQEQPRWPERKAEFISLAFSPGGLVLASGHSDGGIVLWDMAGQRDPVTLMGHEKYVTALAFSRDGRMLISASWDKTVRLWDVSQPERAERVVPHGFWAVGVCFSRDSRHLASVARDHTPADDESIREQHTLKLWEISSMREVSHAPIGGIGYYIYPTFAPDGKFLAVDEMATHLQIHAVPSLRMVTNLAGANPNFSTNGRSMVYASGRRIVRRDSPAAADAVEIVIGESSSKIYGLALSPDGNTAVCAGGDEGDFGIQFWDTRRRRQLGRALGHESRVVKLAFSPDGQRLASASWDGKVGIWDVGKRRLIGLLRGHSGEVYSVDFSPDGLTLVSCGSDATIRLWNTSTWQEIATLGGRAMLAAVAFSFDGQWLAAAANDGTVHVWRAPSWAEIETAANSK